MPGIADYYNQFDEWGRLEREPLEFKVNWHYMTKYLPPSGRILDNGAGPGKYAIQLADRGYDVTLTDLIPRLVNLAFSQAEERGLLDRFSGFHVSDARYLSPCVDGEFDASLMLGPLYHLQEEEDRVKAVKELHRVTREGGIVFVAFMSRTRHILNSLLAPDRWKPNHTMENIHTFSESGRFNHDDEGRFTGAYYFDIDEIKPFMESNGFEQIELISSNVASLFPEDHWIYWKERGPDEWAKVEELLIKEAKNPFLHGISSHLLYIGRRG
ncbi:class I SAM-dependent methyltransferase [Rossellomorea sp. NPDC077527]|uniref:class I SAM-dependent methyltransferase n=1 Tax=Rossellomorea sp. NPDC077527 TaxID=3364510 RepID=UPI0037C9C376